MQVILLILLGLLSGCATMTSSYTGGSDPLDLTIQFADISNKEHVGYCFSDTNLIILDRTYWSRITDSQRAVLLAHEIGHCLFQFQHLNDTDERDCPKSIMFWQVPPRRCLGE